MKRGNRAAIVFAIPFLLLGVCLIGQPVFSAMTKHDATLAWTATVTHIDKQTRTETRRDRFSGRRKITSVTSYTVYIAYEYKGGGYTGTLDYSGLFMKAGQKVKIYLNPERPAEFRSIKPLWMAAIQLIFGAIAIASGIFLCSPAKKRTRGEP